MTEKLNPGGLPTTRRKYKPAFKAECMRQVTASARQTDVARIQGISPALLGQWQHQTLEQAVPNSAEGAGFEQLRVELERVEMKRGSLKKSCPFVLSRRRHEPL